MIKKVSNEEFVRIMDSYLRSSGIVKPGYNFKFTGFDLKDKSNFLEIEISKIKEVG